MDTIFEKICNQSGKFALPSYETSLLELFRRNRVYRRD